MALPERIGNVPYMCTICGGAEQAVFLVTPLSGADTMAVGNACATGALTTLLAGYIDVPPEGLLQIIDTLMQGDEQTPEQVNLPTGYIYGPDGQTILSEDDVDQGLCGLIHDDWWHCHRKSPHSGKHGRAEARPGEKAQPPPVETHPEPATGGE